MGNFKNILGKRSETRKPTPVVIAAHETILFKSVQPVRCGQSEALLGNSPT